MAIADSAAPISPAPDTSPGLLRLTIRRLVPAFFTSLCGVPLGDWCRILAENRFAVDPPYWPRAAILTAQSALNVLALRREHQFQARVAETTVPPPLFILGHWRSGTTLLHYLLALDEQFAYPNLHDVFYPHTFLGTDASRFRRFEPLIPRTRVFDNVAQGLGMPNEDEFALCALSLRSPYMLWAFPRHEAFYERFLTFRGVAEADVGRWKSAMAWFARKLTSKYGRPLLLKSPPHTARIRLLLELFPDARFLHIRRDPYAVFSSTRHLNQMLTGILQLQRPCAGRLEESVLRRYRLMYDAYFDDRALVPRDRLHEISFEELEFDPVGQVRLIYDALGLDGFSGVLPRLEAYVASLSDYRKNEYPPLPASLRRRIGEEWGRAFEEWGYPRD